MTQVIETEQTFLTTDELAEHLRMKTDTVRKWRQRQSGPRFYRVEGKVLYDVDDVNAWLSQQREN